jgi:hypothetical protein
MRCFDIEELLSAYANDELSRTQREFVETHIADCPDCRMKLEDFIDVRRNLASLREMPVLQDIKSMTMSKIQEVDIRKNSRKWLRAALAAIPVVVILAVLMTWQPWNSSSSTQSVMAKAQAAIASLQSYRIVLTSDNDGEISSVEIEFIAPDRYHYKQSGAEFNLEFIIIGDERYFKEAPQTSFEITRMFQSDGYSSLMTREYTLMILDYLTDVQKLPDETIDGTVCLHYKGTYDYEKQMRAFFESNSERGIPPISEEEMKEKIEEMHAEVGTTTVELWIGKDDYLIRQMKRDSQRLDNNGEMQSSTSNFRFYDFNQPFIIEAPVDSEGNLLAGWITTSPEYSHFGTDIKAEVDNYDPSNRKVIFSIILSNISTETLTDVDVDIISVFPSPDKNPEAKIWFSWDNGQWTKGPYNLDPGKSLKYSCTFGYDATSVQPEIIAEMITKSYVGVNYTQADGQQKAETFHFEAPESIYTLSTDVPPHLVPIKLPASGEYRIEEDGATYTGNGVSGEINGREYLFVEVNTAGAETPASPGILVLNIQDKASPRKVAYLSTNDDTRYIRGATLYGTVLYVSVDDSLWVIDVSEPSAPQELSRLPGLDNNQMIISGKYAFINDGNNDIVTLDLSDPAQPVKIVSLPLSSTTSIQMDIFSDYLIAEANDVLNIIDISSPSSLEIVSEYSFRAPLDEETPGIVYPWHIMSTEIEGKYAYVSLSTEGELAIGILDISEPASPHEIAFLRLKDRSFHGPMFVSGKCIYTFTMKSAVIDRRNRLDIIDISEPADPVEIGFCILPDSWSFFSDYYSGSNQTFSLIDSYLYWFLGNSPNKPVIEIFDLSGM